LFRWFPEMQSLFGAFLLPTLWRRLKRGPQSLSFRRHRRLTGINYVGITGSCGKTTTRLLTAAILSEIGVCQHAEAWNRATLMGFFGRLSKQTEYCICEVGATGPGSLSEPLRWLQPQIGIVTNIGSDHYKTFKGLRATALEKGKLVECLPANGVAILNIDDPLVREMAGRTRARVLTFGRTPEADVVGSEVAAHWPDRLSLVVTSAGTSAQVDTLLVGEHWTTSVLASIACGIAFGLDLQTCASALKRIEPAAGRYSVHLRSDGGAYVLDCNKAPAWTIPFVLAFVATARAHRKTVCFGTISDYPGSASKQYRKVARQVLEVADRVIFVGPNSHVIERMRDREPGGRLLCFTTAYEASVHLAETRVPGELVFIKSSRGDHFERLMLADLDSVVCWRDRCGRHRPCPVCKKYRTPYPSPVQSFVAQPPRPDLRS
jgi:UDP-N-acetylmuramoyl-tripeptide--D-alanyl-D-alanine ligase